MRRIKIISIALFILLIFFVGNIFLSTGFFRSIENEFDGRIVKKIALPGAEDITVSMSDSFALISSTDRRGYRPYEDRKDGLYYLDLKSGNYDLIALSDFLNRPFKPHGISMIKRNRKYHIMAINHTAEGHSIEVFELVGEKLTFIKTMTDPSIVSPNDIVMIDENRFYFTNDHAFANGLGRIIEDYAGLAISNVIYYDGKSYKEVADGIAYANGINFDRNRNLMFVASPRGFLVKVYARNDDGSLDFIDNISCGTGVDNIEFDTAGNLWIGAHPNLLRFTAYARGTKATSPSELIKIEYRGKEDYAIERIYLDDGSTMSGSTVAALFGNLILTGNVMDSTFLILEQRR